MAERSGSRVRGVAAFALGYVSIILGYWVFLYFGYSFAYYRVGDPSLLRGRTWRVFLYEWTKPAGLAYMLTWVGLAAASAGLGYWLVRRERGDGSSRLAASAARLAKGGLAGVAIDLAVLGLMLGYRVWLWRG